ncbi:MAG: DNA gyrase/topoisomerase IV subunit A [Bacteroidia bacterium]|nr:DNA gyrase/topoisomerase IV subunit A [Bacteroidia bacterium]MCF8428000.1 DNA gyrase/topoisomerase IV subunit A [Bacteroidia bacterium]MCF8445724.1 DNA gyrase/topoisomerase IV subunit A [Bacteroidia bacterium]
MEENNIDETKNLHESAKHNEYHVTTVNGLYENWFLDYASYVILERAVPAIDDGLKPVQRRILHSMKEMDDGRFNKVANVIGQTMQYHPHGDAAIGDAMVNLGQKDLMIETQGNWGDFRTGDSAAAPRYIEARLSKFALEVAFNKQTTIWQSSYDGRKKEPIALPMKFPLLLAQGVEGIAVGLATKVMPHNFNELLQASIDYLKGKKFELFPDFPTGGMVDVANYNQGKKGGKIRVRAKIEEFDKKTLFVKDVPYGVTTTQLIDSIIKANDSGKIKIKKVIDNTAKDVEIEIQLAPGVSPDKTMDALYAFTDCEVSISPNACVIVDDKPVFIGVEELLQISTEKTKDLLRQELEIKKNELEEQWHYSSIEKIFIEKRIYRDIEESESFEEVIDVIWKGMNKYRKLFRRELTEDDILRLTEIKIKRISKYDSFKADEIMKGIEANLEEVKFNLDNLRAYAIKYFENLLKKYGKGKERKTEIRTFDTIDSKTVAIANQKLYVNKAEGFVGIGLKKDEYVCDCSDLDDIIVFRKDGKMVVSKVQEKSFFGKDILHVDVFHKNDERRIYNLIYLDGKTKISYAKRFPVTGITRDKEYDLTQGSNGSRILYFTANPAGEAEVVNITLSPLSHARKLSFDFDFSELAIKGRGVQGNILSKYLVKGIKLKTKGVSTLGGLNLWYDEAIGRINTQEHGNFLGNFAGNDLIIAFYKDGNYELTNFDVSNHYEYEQLLHISKFKPERPIALVYYDAKAKQYNIKRFIIETQTLNKKFACIPEEKGNYILLATDYKNPVVILTTGKGKTLLETQINLTEFIEVKGAKAIGNRFALADLSKLELLPPDPQDEIEEEIQDEQETLVNEDLFTQEQEKIKKLLEDDPETDEQPKKKPGKIDPDQPKLF